MGKKWILEFRWNNTGFCVPHILLLAPNVSFLTFLALLMELNYSTWV